MISSPTGRRRFSFTLTAALLCHAAASDVALSGEIALFVDRTSGDVSISNNSGADLPIVGYSLTSDAGAFSPLAWTPVMGNYDSAGDRSVDNDNRWTVLSGGGAHDLSEAELEGGDGGVLGAGGMTIHLGAAWLRSPYEDVKAELLLNSGTILAVGVTYLGSPVAAGDLNGDGFVDAIDWRNLRAAYRSDLTGFTKIAAHSRGDMNGDGQTNALDFVLFKASYETENGAGAFASLLSGVPEPSGLCLAALGSLAIWLSRRFRTTVGAPGSRLLVPSVCLVVAIAVSTSRGQTIEAFNYSTGSLSGRNGGAGWGGAWRNAISRTGGDWTLAGPGLDYPAMATEVGITATSPGDGSRFQRNLSQTFSTGTAFLSYLSSNSTTGLDPYSAFELQLGGDADSFRVFQMGLLRGDDGNPSGGNEGAFFARSRGSVGGGGGDQAWVADFNTDANLFVVRFDLDTDSAEVFFNPNDRVDLAGPGDATLDLFTGFAFDRIGIANFVGSNQFSVDEIRIATTPPTLAAAPEIELVVDRSRGVVRLQNRSMIDIDIDLYEITSSASSLKRAGWHSLQQQDYDGQGAPHTPPIGDGWEEFDGADASFVSEAFLTGTSTIAGGTQVTLGKLYDVAIDAQDLRFTYHDVGGGLVEVKVVYESLNAPPGDYNGDDLVNAADYSVFRDNFGGNADAAFAAGSRGTGLTGPIGALDYEVWTANYGKSATSSPTAGQSLAAPEPTSFAIVTMGCSIAISMTRVRTHSLSN